MQICKRYLRFIFDSLSSLLSTHRNSTSLSSCKPAMTDDRLCPAPPESYPLQSLEELEDLSYLNSFHFAFNKSSVPLLAHQSTGGDRLRSRLLVCHDMKGGYQDDKWVQGSPNADAYSLWHWHIIDIFVYFSHSLVTLPPPCWTNTAHRHGVQVLGTFITEWDAGKAICKRLLASKESTYLYASRLSKLAEVLGFDGWLINIENEVEQQHISNLLEFVRLLTKLTHERVPGSKVIWYDSVTKDGKLRWQDCLNDMNKCFFDLCDGIFTNYTWKRNYPEMSAAKAGVRKTDVYMGIDVFGRNTYGGGGFQTNVALEAAKHAGVSAAIFAPAWVYETNQGPTFSSAQNRWWGLVSECWPSAQKYPLKLPFFSSFDQGFGREFYINGNRVSAAPWSNISCQNFQPLLRLEMEAKKGLESVVSGDYPVYSGGACIKFSGEVEEQAYLTTLYEAHVAVDMPFMVTYTVRKKDGSSLSLLLKMQTKKGTLYILLLDLEGRTAHDNSYDFEPLNLMILNSGNAAEHGQAWSLRKYRVEETGIIKAIVAVSYPCMQRAQMVTNLCKRLSSGNTAGVSFGTANAIATSSSRIVMYEASLGHVAISNPHEHDFSNMEAFECPFECTYMCWEELDGKRFVSLTLTWKIKLLLISRVMSHHIYMSRGSEGGQVEHVGVAMVGAFYVSQLEVSESCKTLTFYLQSCCTCGFASPLEDAPRLELVAP